MRNRHLHPPASRFLAAAVAAVVAAIVLPAGAAGTARGTIGPAIPSIPGTIAPAEWSALGPFSVGPREGITGIADDPDSLIPPSDDFPAARARYPSMLAQGGFVTWKSAEPDSTGWTTVAFDSVLWDTLASVYGAPGVVNVSYAYCSVERPREERALVVAERVGSFYVNGVLHNGDPYGNNYVRIPVVLRRGENRILLRLSGYGDPSFKFELIPVPGRLVLLDDYTTPDLLAGETGAFWISVPILNTTTETIATATITIGDGEKVSRERMSVSNLAALCVRKVPLEIEVIAPAGSDTLAVPIEIADGGESYADTIALRVREIGQSFKRTFISKIDCSCQYYAVLPPTGYDPTRGRGDRADYALIFTLHGAGVRAEGQADAYKAKPWAFIVAPTNRRPFGFDWQDWGMLDALEVLEEVQTNYPIDPDRVYLTGHSMGGHGVWQVGLAHPDLFAAMGPGAGWTSFELYIPWFLQKTNIYGDPFKVAVRNAGLLEDATLNYVENAANLPVFIFQGGADDNVPPVHPRMFVGRLDDLGYEYRYKEIPGKGHWWTIDSLGTSCVDDPDLMAFFEGLRRDSHPSRVIFKTADLGKSDHAYWVRIDRQETPFRMSQIDATVVEGPESYPGLKTLKIATDNVDEFTIFPSGQLFGESDVMVTLDGRDSFLGELDGSPLTFAKRAGEFRLGGRIVGEVQKSHDRYGPMKQVYFSPFVLIYGTAADSAEVALLQNQARLEAWQWWMRGNGLAEVLADTSVTRWTIGNYNLVLFGGPDENKITRMLNREVPIRIVDGEFYLGSERIKHPDVGGGFYTDLPGSSLAAEFVYPNPLAPDRLVFVHEGIGQEGLRLSTFFGTLSSAAGLPDFMIFDERVRKQGWAGVVEAGFFDSAWKIAR